MRIRRRSRRCHSRGAGTPERTRDNDKVAKSNTIALAHFHRFDYPLSDYFANFARVTCSAEFRPILLKSDQTRLAVVRPFDRREHSTKLARSVLLTFCANRRARERGRLHKAVTWSLWNYAIPLHQPDPATTRPDVATRFLEHHCASIAQARHRDREFH
jgi:hypothetical protein